MRKLIGLYLLLLAGVSFAADAPVEDLGAGASSRGSTAVSGGLAQAQGPQNQALTNLHFEVQSLQDEMRELRGIVEMQANELQQLKQRQLDDFQDLDRRISAMGAGGQSESSIPSLVGGSQGTGSGGSMAAGSDGFGTSAAPEDDQFGSAEQAAAEGEYEAYTASYNLLKTRKIDEAVAGFNQFVAKFPNGQYTANAYYWLGEIYLLQNELDKAGSAFGRVVDEFPAHPKANDAKFKLARVYHLQGSDDKAKSLLREVADTNSGAASLAQSYLNDNF